LAIGSAQLFDYVFDNIKKRYLVAAVLALAFVVQIFSLSIAWHPVENYEKILARNLKIELDNKKVAQETPVLSYAPEPIYLETGRPSYKFWKKSADWEKIAPDKEIILVMDEAVYRDDPATYDKLFAYFADKQLGYFRIETPLFIKAESLTPTRPVILIQTTRMELEKVLSLVLTIS